jgi:hypothetical protein
VNQFVLRYLITSHAGSLQNPLERDQLGSEFGQTCGDSPGKPKHQRDVAILDISEITHTCPQGLDVAHRGSR